MQTGDVFALRTDGFYEWARADKERFGVERVMGLVASPTGFEPVLPA